MSPTLTCSCGVMASAEAWSCERRGHDDGDHVLGLPRPHEWVVDEHPNPLVRYRRMLFVHTEAMAAGLGDDRWVELADRLDAAVYAIDRRRFVVTPIFDLDGINEVTEARVTVKDETGNVSGSHKARHLGGLMLDLLAREATGRLTGRPPLAIASCGNAALAAAVISAATEWPLRVFVPPDGDAETLDRLDRLGADVVACPRDEAPGDPTYRAFAAAVEAGAIPFGCQGPDNGRTIDGGRTLGYELAEQIPDLSRIVVQVGGGALVSGVAQGLAIAAATGVVARSPTVDTVQTTGCAPLARAYERTVALGGIAAARATRSDVMWPWQPTPTSIASGILDDETYDWRAAVEAMLLTDGTPVVVSDDLIVEARHMALDRTDTVPSHTGVAGLAGLLALARDGALDEIGIGRDRLGGVGAFAFPGERFENLVAATPRANGGNMDDPNMVAGTTVYFPAFVTGALFSIGDTHAAQGQGEVCGTAIEAPMRIVYQVDVIKGGHKMAEPQYETDDTYAVTAFATTLDEAAKKATRYMVDYLTAVHGLERTEAYVLCSLAANLKIAEVVDVPHVLVTMQISKEILGI